MGGRECPPRIKAATATAPATAPATATATATAPANKESELKSPRKSKAKIVFGVRVDAEDAHAFDELARSKGVNRSGLTRMLIKEAIRKPREA